MLAMRKASPFFRGLAGLRGKKQVNLGFGKINEVQMVFFSEMKTSQREIEEKEEEKEAEETEIEIEQEDIEEKLADFKNTQFDQKGAYVAPGHEKSVKTYQCMTKTFCSFLLYANCCYGFIQLLLTNLTFLMKKGRFVADDCGWSCVWNGGYWGVHKTHKIRALHDPLEADRLPLASFKGAVGRGVQSLQGTKSFTLNGVINVQQFPEYELSNRDMDLEGFKPIFLIEYAHRTLGNIIGGIFILPFLYFWSKNRLGPKLKRNLFLLLLMVAKYWLKFLF
jgi:Cytochrome oxidase assembly protein